MTKRILLTAFQPYGAWRENASWLALVELTKDMPCEPQITTRLYPVDFAATRGHLARDLEAGYDVALHLGQAPGSGRIALETIGVNVGGLPDEPPERFRPLADDGPVAYRSALPLERWSGRLREEGIPAAVSYHAGTYLCNATLYWSHYLAEQMDLAMRSAFIHVPLAPGQVNAQRRDLASLPSTIAARAVRVLIGEIGRE